ncbi:hypothetical protein ACFQZZ_01335 [Nocardia sp. GCM10030253]|uniref:hypothetical protein n=1 Tax=Nocardia sp. GCM10030253 TaxID=3273404 RepID=UPI003637FD49
MGSIGSVVGTPMSRDPHHGSCGRLVLEANSANKFMAMLRHMLAWSGLTAGQVAVSSKLLRSTACRFVDPKNATLPKRRVQVEAFARACRLTPQLVTRVLSI